MAWISILRRWTAALGRSGVWPSGVSETVVVGCVETSRRRAREAGGARVRLLVRGRARGVRDRQPGASSCFDLLCVCSLELAHGLNARAGVRGSIEVPEPGVNGGGRRHLRRL
jgi:hypothetical protein